MGNLILKKPIASPSVTVRMASGLASIENGILVPRLAAPAGAELYHHLTNATDWAAAPIWEHLAGHGADVAAIGRPATHPAKVFSGLVV